MINLLCGFLIGSVLGLTGAGGALVAIPLFMQFLALSLKEASLLSLVAVVIAAFTHFMRMRKATDFFTGSLIVAASAFASYLSSPLKAQLSALWVALLLSAVAIYALVSIWRPRPALITHQSSHAPWPLSLLIGSILGILTTLTGLGGGVLMLPVLQNIYRFDSARAMATSLFAVGLSSLSSLLIQLIQGAQIDLGVGLLFLVIGIICASWLIGFLTKSLSPGQLLRLRQIVFTLVVVLTLSKIF